MARLVVTGASGFLGSALARHWAARGHDVHALVRSTSALARLQPASERLTLHVADAPDAAAAVVGALAPDAIAHTACAYGRAGESARAVFEANVALGVAMLQAVADGAAPVTFLNTGSALAPDVSLYALSKRQFSDWGAAAAARDPQRLRFVDLRLQHMYGAGDDASKFSTRVLHACHANEPALDLTAGEQRRDFIYIDDVVSAYDAVLARAGELAAHEIIAVGSGHAPPLRKFVELVHRLTAARTELRFGALPYRPNEAMHCDADTARLRSLGWQPAFDLASGLRETLRKEFSA